MRRFLLAGLLLLSSAAVGEEYRVEAIKDKPSGAGLSPEIAAQLAPSGVKVVAGDKRVVCEIWPAKQWTSQPDFQPSDTVLYPLKVGSLVGVLRFPRGGADFRGQQIPSGLYTLRYGNQPVDGNHVGTFDTRDFLLMLPAKADQSAAPIDEMDLFKVSAESAESSHPAIVPLVKAEEGKAPALRNIEEKEWWTLRLVGKDADGKSIPAELVVVGKAAE